MQFLKYWCRSFRWHEIDRKGVTGKLVRGDKTAPESTDNALKMFFVRLAWKKVVLAAVEANGKPFYVGFRNYAGETWLCDSPLTGSGFRAKLGQEDVTFFVIDEYGTELTITLATTLSKEVANGYSDKDYPRV